MQARGARFSPATSVAQMDDRGPQGPGLRLSGRRASAIIWSVARGGAGQERGALAAGAVSCALCRRCVPHAGAVERDRAEVGGEGRCAARGPGAGDRAKAIFWCRC